MKHLGFMRVALSSVYVHSLPCLHSRGGKEHHCSAQDFLVCSDLVYKFWKLHEPHQAAPKDAKPLQQKGHGLRHKFCQASCQATRLYLSPPLPPRREQP